MFAHGSVCLRSCTVQVCRVPSTSRLIGQPGVEDNLLDVPVIVSKRGQRSREQLVESVEKVYFGNSYSGEGEGEGGER